VGWKIYVEKECVWSGERFEKEWGESPQRCPKEKISHPRPDDNPGDVGLGEKKEAKRARRSGSSSRLIHLEKR